MKKLLTMVLAAMAVLAVSCKKETKLSMQFPDRFEGKTVEMTDFLDSTLLMKGEVHNGVVEFTVVESDSVKLPMMTLLSVDGKVCAYYVAEPGNAVVSDSTNLATGTPTNDRFTALVAQMDSIEDLDDMDKYVAFAEQQYNANKDNAIGDFFGVEWLKYADPERVDSMMQTVPESFRDAKRVRHYVNFAKLRQATSPGHPYVDFAGKDAAGRDVMFSKYIKPGKYTLVDFWASWCPYCIKEIPELKQLLADFGDKGFEIVGVAVRDLPDDTKASIEKREITWPVMFDTQRVPYDIYGFSGIPHHMLIGPDGKIVSRGETPAQIRTRLESIE